MNISKFIPVALLGIFSLGLTTSCSKNESSENGIEVTEAPEDSREIILTEEQFQTMKMEWGPLHTGEFSEEITVQGSIQIPVEGMREISAYYGGYVQDLKLLEGQPVRKGEVLFTLENPDFIRLQQDYLETKSQLTYLKAEFERQQTLAAEQISAKKNYLKAEADYQSAMAKAESLKKQLSLIQINADQLTPEIRYGVSRTENMYGTEARGKFEKRRIELNNRMAQIFSEVDLIITASNPDVAFNAEGPLPDTFGGIVAGAGNNGVLTFPANIYGNPGISVPVGFVDGLPVGMQIMARHFEEPLLLDLALALERTNPWPLTTPNF